MDNFTRKTFTTSRSLKYAYYDSAPAKPLAANKPTLFFIHGFPDDARLWKDVFPHLSSLPHRIIAIDQLGYGESSKPDSTALYNSRAVSADIAELLAAEQTSQIVAIGHDWGSSVAQRLWLWHPALVAGVAMLNVAYIPPVTTPFDLHALNAHTEQATGFPRYAYWELFADDDGAQALLDARLESLWCVVHGAREHWMRDMFCVRGAMRRFLEEDGRVELKPHARPGAGWKEEWFKTIRENGGVGAQLHSYKALAHNHHYEVEKNLPEERAPITVPTFFLGCERDEVALPAFIEPSRAAGLLPDLTVKVIDSGHWCTMEKPDEVGQALYGFLSERF
ncbi:hypothetical protein SLS57_009657 [Botryosphaeria dothidea]